MPIAIRYIDGGKGVILTGEGVVTGTDLLAANKEIYSRDLVAEPYHYGLFDADGLTGITASTEEMRALAAASIAVARRMPRFVIAIYAKDSLTFGLARMWEAFVEQSGWITHVFRERPRAVAWVKAEVEKRLGLQIALE